MDFKAGYVWDYFLAGCCDFLGFLLVAWQPHIDEETSGNISQKYKVEICFFNHIIDEI